MRVGVICEGQTDFVAIQNFIGMAARNRGLEISFVALQPDMDATRPTGGWSTVLQWLQRNPPESRIRAYLGQGLFAGRSSVKNCDCFLVQMDSDILNHESFSKFISDNIGVIPAIPHDCSGRAGSVVAILSKFARIDECTERDRNLHHFIPAVESTEAWCIGVFERRDDSPEELKGQALINAFMKVLEQSESRTPQESYNNVDKDVARRVRFCENHSGGVEWMMSSCNVLRENIDAMIGKIKPT